MFFLINVEVVGEVYNFKFECLYVICVLFYLLFNVLEFIYYKIFVL